MKARRVSDMSTAQLMRRAAAYQAARPRYSPALRTFGRSNGELKGMDTLLTISPILGTTNTNGSSITLNLINPGSASYNRIGRKLRLSSLRLKGAISFQMSASAVGSVPGQGVRMVVVWDKQTNGALPAFQDIFGYTTLDGTETSTILSPPKYDNMARFQVLKDVLIEPETLVPGVVTTGVIEQLIHFDHYISLKGKEVTYGGQNVPCTIADITTGGLYVYFRSQVNTPSNLAVVDADSVARLRYID